MREAGDEERDATPLVLSPPGGHAGAAEGGGAAGHGGVGAALLPEERNLEWEQHSRVKFETVQGESFAAECPIAATDSADDVGARLRRIGTHVISAALGKASVLGLVSIQFYDREKKAMVEVEEETPVASIKAASELRVLVLGLSQGPPAAGESLAPPADGGAAEPKEATNGGGGSTPTQEKQPDDDSASCVGSVAGSTAESGAAGSAVASSHASSYF